MAKRRRFTPQFKAEVVIEALSGQSSQSVAGLGQWVNRIENLDICRRNQVWVGDITYVRLKGQFVYVAVLMDVFTRMVRG